MLFLSLMVFVFFFISHSLILLERKPLKVHPYWKRKQCVNVKNYDTFNGINLLWFVFDFPMVFICKAHFPSMKNSIKFMHLFNRVLKMKRLNSNLCHLLAPSGKRMTWIKHCSILGIWNILENDEKKIHTNTHNTNQSDEWFFSLLIFRLIPNTILTFIPNENAEVNGVNYLKDDLLMLIQSAWNVNRCDSKLYDIVSMQPESNMIIKDFMNLSTNKWKKKTNKKKHPTLDQQNKYRCIIKMLKLKMIKTLTVINFYVLYKYFDLRATHAFKN